MKLNKHFNDFRLNIKMIEMMIEMIIQVCERYSTKLPHTAE